MCPNNRLGTVDLLLGLHHGQSSSNSPVIVHALHPRVAIMNDGTRKGGEPETMQTVHSSPGLEDLWQLAFLVAERPGVHPAGNVHRQHGRRPAAGHACCSDGRAHTRTGRAPCAGAQWHGLLDQALGANQTAPSPSPTPATTSPKHTSPEEQASRTRESPSVAFPNHSGAVVKDYIYAGGSTSLYGFSAAYNPVRVE